MTLATTAVDIVRALLEGIACDFALTLDRLRGHGIEARLVRATGGGSRNAWWLQLMADVSGVPVEVVAQDEPGAFGAAILAGVGAGVYAVGVGRGRDAACECRAGSNRTRSGATATPTSSAGWPPADGPSGDDAPSPAAPSPPPVDALSTPALVVDLDVFEANVAAMAALVAGTGKTIRPHVKTHRTPELARRQLGGPAIGVTCATVGEAEAMVEAGIDDVLVANEVVDPRKIARLAALARRARVARRGRRPGAGRAARARGRPGRGRRSTSSSTSTSCIHRCGVASVDGRAAAGARHRRTHRRSGCAGSWATRAGSG